MPYFFISLGIVNKSMTFPLIYIIVIILYNFYSLTFKYNEVSLFIVGLGSSIGELLLFFLSQVFKSRRITRKTKKAPIKQYIKDYHSFL